ncbi:MAG: hypothetical protein K0U29_00135, partial [Gammaproteobacteria bacterium]|nr:hypothetical protein [Gammaproteobacteria bacterium]
LRPIILSPEDTSELHKCFSSKSRTISVNITSLAKLSEKLGHDFFTILFYQPNPAKEEYKLKKYIHCKPMRVEATPTPTVNDGRDSRVASAVPSDLMDEDDHSGFSSPANPLLACKPVELPNAGFFGRQMRPILQPLSPDSPVKAAPAAASSGGLFSAKAFSSPSGTTNSQTYSSLEFKPIGEHHLRAVISIKIKKAGDYLNNLRSSLRVRLGVSHESRLLFNSCFESIGSPIDPANGKRTITITVDTKELSELDPGYEEQLFYEAKPGIYMLLPYAPAAADASQLQRSFAAAARR